MRSTDPLASILLPARDAASTLETCLRSVRRQSEPRFECVIVEDGSRDDTGKLAGAFARRDGRFRVIPADGGGIVRALNIGLRHCRGRYVARMDADDAMHGRRLELQIEALERDPGLAAVGSHVRLFPRDGLGPGMREYERWLNGIRNEHDVRREAFVECPLAHPASTIRREVLARHGYRDRGWPEDYDLVLRLLENGERLSVVRRRLLLWRAGPESLSRRAGTYAPDRFIACKAEFLSRGFLRERRDYVLWGYGGTGRLLARELAARGKRPSHIVEIHPGRLGNRILGVEVVPPERLGEMERRPVIVSVARRGPRRKIRQALHAMGFREPEDFICAA